jgi:uracil-DNA glycosylase family 4
MNLNHMLGSRSDFSLGESMLQIEHLVADAKEKGYESVTLMDTMSLNGLVDFSNRCKKAGLKPVIGCRIRVVEDPTYRKPSKASGERERPNPLFMLKAYVVDERGVASLMKLLSKAYSEDYFYYHARVGMKEVLELEGVIVSTGDLFSIWHVPDHDTKIAALQCRFGSVNVFSELVPINTPLFDTLNGKALDAAMRLDMPTLVTYPTFYRNAEAAESLEVLKCIVTNTKMDVRYRSVQYVKDFYIHEPDAIKARVKDAAQRVHKYASKSDPKQWIEGLNNIEGLVAACNYKFDKQPVSLPQMAPNEFVALGKKCIEGWKRRFGTEILGHKPDHAEMKVYQERLAYELSVLKKMGFAGYFLLVEDLVVWAKENGIIVGPGRGSVGGSLVAYLIGITDVDPIRFNLLFERFINPERLDLPDADLDFMSSKRHMVIEYLTAKYGKDRVAGISNYSTLASASALRDAGRMYGLNGIELTATKLVPKEHGQSFTLTEAAKAVPEIDKFRDDQPEIWAHALNLEGAMRAYGRHAAGVVVAGEPLINRAVVETRADAPVVNWDKRTVEDWGLVKMDILGLSTLDVMEIAKSYIKDRHGIEVDYLALPLEQPDVMEAFGRGDTTGVFQFESPGMKKLLRDLATGGTLTFEDITAATALYRPGPMDSGLMDDYVAIKKGIREPYYDHPNMENALKATFGVIVYQEQVMQVAVDLAGFTRAEADHLRKAMGKKDKDKMAEMRQKWNDGCKANVGMDERTAGGLFDKIEAFAGYGFNRSHAVEYSIISYWTMWLRVNYPAEYFAACMSIVDEEKLPGLVKDAREVGIEVMPPDINVSRERYTIPDDKTILAPFSSVKGISENTALRIVELRERNRGWKLDRVKKKRDGTVENVYAEDDTAPVKGRFDSLEEFALAAGQPGSKVNARVVENLDKVGAFAKVEPSTVSAKHFSRRKDQMELMPGLIIDNVKADRTTDLGEAFLRAKVIHLIQHFKRCDGCDLKDAPHPAPRAKSTVKFMVVSDCPTWQEEKKDKLLEGDAAQYVKLAIKNAGLNVAEGYYTTLVKAKKSEKFLTNGQINGCSQWLNKELELIKPAVIVALGSATIKRFVPGLKGGAGEMVGKTFYDPVLDATIVCGLNAQQIGFDPDKQEVLDAVFAQVADVLS